MADDQSAAACIDFFSQIPGWLERHNSSGVQGEFIAGLWIAPPTWILVPDIELAESAQEEIGSIDKGVLGEAKKCLNRLDSLGLGKIIVISDYLLDEICLGDCHQFPPLELFRYFLELCQQIISIKQKM